MSKYDDMVERMVEDTFIEVGATDLLRTDPASPHLPLTLNVEVGYSERPVVLRYPDLRARA